MAEAGLEFLVFLHAPPGTALEVCTRIYSRHYFGAWLIYGKSELEKDLVTCPRP